MPIYTFACSECREPFEILRPMAQYQEPATCPLCDGLGVRTLSAVRIVGDYPGYECPVSGEWVEGRKAHEENLKKTGCRIYEPGETADFQRRKAREEAAFDHAVEESVGRAVEALPAEKKLQLAKELSTGAEAQTVRG